MLIELAGHHRHLTLRQAGDPERLDELLHLPRDTPSS
jgi:hypothetical protein